MGHRYPTLQLVVRRTEVQQPPELPVDGTDNAGG